MNDVRDIINVRTYVIHLLGTYVNILCNWLILWQNTLYLYLGRFIMFLILQETRFQDQVLKSSSLSKKQDEKCKFIKAQQLHLLSLRRLFQPRVLDTCLTVSRQLLFVEVRGEHGLGWRDFLTQPTMVGKKKFNPTQPIT